VSADHRRNYRWRSADDQRGTEVFDTRRRAARLGVVQRAGAGERLPELLTRRIAAALRARAPGVAAYLENGFPVA
jgi:hypothetical protein